MSPTAATLEALKQIYHDPEDPGSLGGVDRLLQRARKLKVSGVNRAMVKQFLRGEQAYSLHKPARRHYKRNPIYVAGIDAQWQADLADMQTLARQNNGMRYLLTVIDVFSKFAWVAPVKSKDASAISLAFKEVLEEAAPRRPRRLQTDKGKEFFNSSFAALMRRHSIQHFASDSDQKAAVVERFNRTIKTRLWTYMSDRGSVRWLDVLSNLVNAYNHSHHRSIGMAPADVTEKDTDRIWVRLYGDGNTYLKQQKPLPVGAMVRLNKAKAIFDKGYMPNWTKEHFTIAESAPDHSKKKSRRQVYKIKDFDGEPITGSFYPEELQHISDNQYRIERVLRRRTTPDGSKQIFVKWEGWPEKYNSWINEADQYNVAR